MPVSSFLISLSDFSASSSNHPTVNLSSLEQNARRMLDNMESNIPLEEYAKTLVFDTLKLERLEIPLDRTNLERGDADINYFTIISCTKTTNRKILHLSTNLYQSIPETQATVQC